MAFNSTIFIFLFAPVVVLLALVVPRRAANAYLLAASMLFYAWGEPRFVFVVLASGLADYLIASVIARPSAASARALWLGLGVCVNLGLLIYFKYAAFFIQTLGAVFGGLRIPHPEIILPLGISFIVFEKITYIVDVYRGTTPPARNVLDYLLFVFFFPKMLSGPIIKYHEISEQIQSRRIALEDVEVGVSRFIVGLAKKVLVADTLAGVADKVFAAPLEQIGCADGWLAALCFAIEIYFDFSGYSDMAIGLARMLGFRLRENFNQPYLAVGFTEFWQRWHISLSSWIRDYLYIPLGGNRRSPPRVYANLWICFLASGLWHGASWTFVIWGAYHGLFVSADRLILRRVWLRIPRVAGVAVTFLLVVIGWIFFRSGSFGQAVTMLGIMANPWRPSQLIDLWVTNDIYLCLVVGFIVSFVPWPWVEDAAAKLPEIGVGAVRQAGILALSLWVFGQLFTASFKPFLYFRF